MLVADSPAVVASMTHIILYLPVLYTAHRKVPLVVLTNSQERRLWQGLQITPAKKTLDLFSAEAYSDLEAP